MNRCAKITIIIICTIVLVLFSLFVAPRLLSKTYTRDGSSQSANATTSFMKSLLKKEEVGHVLTPDAVKAVYMSACAASSNTFREHLTKLIKETELNSIIIDVKDYSGTISIDTGMNLAGEKASGCRVADMKDFIKTLHEQNIYVIARITVFQDPYYTTQVDPKVAVTKKSDGTTWKDYKGLSFVDVGAKDYWKYIVDLSRASYEIGFDEINFDYIRYPSDGNMKDIYFPHSQSNWQANDPYPKATELKKFFAYLHEELKKDGITMSADLFGMTMTNPDDLNIGQILEYALPYFDYIAPMVYPSHYFAGFNGWANPNDYPYEVVNHSMKEGVRRIEQYVLASSTRAVEKETISKKQLRPWLQDFDYGGNYGPAEVKEQIQATYDAGLDSWMLWDPSNQYTRTALISE